MNHRGPTAPALLARLDASAILVLAMIQMALLVLTAPAAAQTTRKSDDDGIDRRWLERLDAEERTTLEQHVGYAPPEFPATLTWVSDTDPDGTTFAKLRGKVVVIQSWTTRSSTGRRVPVRLARTLGKFGADDVYVVLLHTPEGAEKAQLVLERQPPSYPVAMDSAGAYCDALGVYKRPANIIVDRNGVMRYAGLNARGLAAAVEALVAEAPDPKVKAAPRPVVEPTEQTTFPPITGTVSGALDMRGLSGPQLVVDRWMTPKPRSGSPVLIITFWTPSVEVSARSLVRLDTMARPFGSAVMIVGISDESRADYEELVDDLEDDTNIRLETLSCVLAIDDEQRMKRAARIDSIPHTLVLSRDWIVRWQGAPTRLKPDILERIVAADRAQAGEGKGASRRKTWADEKR